MKINQDILYLCIIILIGLVIPYFLGSWSREGFKSKSSSDVSTTPASSTATLVSRSNNCNSQLENNDLESKLNTDMNMIQNKEIYQ